MKYNTKLSFRAIIAVCLLSLAAIHASAQRISMVSYEQNWSDNEGTLTLKNNTSNKINNVRFRIIYYAMDGTQLDYKDYSEDVDIDPGMTRRVDIPAFEHRREYCYYTSQGLSNSVRFKVGFKELGSEDETEPQIQEITSSVNETSEHPFTIVDKMPSFKGNVNAWLAQHIQYPAAAAERGAQGVVIVRFIVNKDGSVSDISVVRSIDSDLDKEAIRLVGNMPKWNPGLADGKPARVWFTLPVSFKLQKKLIMN